MHLPLYFCEQAIFSHLDISFASGAVLQTQAARVARACTARNRARPDAVARRLAFVSLDGRWWAAARWRTAMDHRERARFK